MTAFLEAGGLEYLAGHVRQVGVIGEGHEAALGGQHEGGPLGHGLRERGAEVRVEIDAGRRHTVHDRPA